MYLWVSGWTVELLNMKALRSSETWGITFPATQYHVPEDLNTFFNPKPANVENMVSS